MRNPNEWYCPTCEVVMKWTGGWSYRCDCCGESFDTEKDNI